MKNKNLTPRENLLLAYSHRCPEWIPYYITDICGRLPIEVHERAPGGPQGGTGVDWFGVHWRAVPGIAGATVDTTIPPVLDDVTKWEDVVKFPDLDAVDWKAAQNGMPECTTRQRSAICRSSTAPTSGFTP